MQYKIRTVSKCGGDPRFGITIPRDIQERFSGCYFKIEISNGGILFQSGTSIVPTKEEVKNYEFENRTFV